MRERVEVGRARIRTSARIVVVTTVLTIVVLWVFAGEILAAYDSLAGQLWMCVVAAVFVAGGAVLRHFSAFDLPDRFTARRRAGGSSVGDGALAGAVGDAVARSTGDPR